MSDHLHRNRTLWLCTALHAFTHIYQIALIPLYLLIRRDLHLESVGQATMLVTALSIAYFLPSYPMGILADRTSRKKLLGFGLAINALGFISLSFAHSYGFALVSAVLAGLGGSFYHPAATALIVRLYPEAPGKALGKAAIGASIGFFIAPIYAGWRGEMAGWRAPVLELGLMGLVGAALFLWFAHDHVMPPRDAKSTAPKERLFPTTALWILFIASAFLFCLRDFAGAGMATLASLFLQKAHGFSPQQTGLAVGSIYLASAISNPIFGGLSDRGRIRWAILVLCLAAATMAIFPHLGPEWFTPALGIFGFFFMASYPMVEAGLMEAVPDAVRGRVFGIFITFGGLLGNLSHWIIGDWVQNLGPAVAAAPRNYFGIYAILALFILLSLGGLACLHGIHRREETL